MKNMLNLWERKKTKLPHIFPDPEMDHNEMIDILTQAGYIIHKSNPDMESPESSLRYSEQLLSLVVGCFSCQPKNLLNHLVQKFL